MLFSICIPTYNRPNALRLALHNYATILKKNNLEEKVEICISDNSTTNENKKIVSFFKNKLKISYTKNKTNIGYDRNAVRVLSLAKGKYVQLVSDECKYSADTLVKIVELLSNKKPDVIYMHRKSFPMPSNSSNVLSSSFSIWAIKKRVLIPLNTLLFKRDFFILFKKKFKKKLAYFYGTGFIHLPLFIYVLRNAKETIIYKNYDEKDDIIFTQRQKLYMPHEISRVLYRNYFFTIKYSCDLGILDKYIFEKFRRNFLLLTPYSLFIMRIIIPSFLYSKSVPLLLKDINSVKVEYNSIFSSFIFSFFIALLYTKKIPYHLIYYLWMFFKQKIYGDTTTINFLEAYSNYLKNNYNFETGTGRKDYY